MGDGELEVSLRAKFSSNLDAMGRQLGAFQQRARGYARDMRDWARGVPTEKMLQTHIRLGAELDGIQGKMRGAKEEYLKWSEKAHVPGLDRKALGEAKKNADEALQIMTRLFQDQARIKGQMGLMGRGEGGIGGFGGGGRQGMVGTRRMLRFGLGALGLPLTIAAAGRSVGEAQEQEKLIQGLATRIRPLNEGMEGFDQHVIRLRTDIVDAGAEFAFAGREVLMLADSLSRISGLTPDLRATLEGSRGMGISPQLSGQLLAFTRRFGEGPVGGGSRAGDERLMNIVAKGISRTGMGPRGGEYIQTIVETMQQYATRMPSLQPDTIESLVYAINKTGIPTLRGQGASTLTQGMTGMMDDMSEAMIAMQTEILTQDPSLMRRFAARNLPGVRPEELQTGAGKYFALMALKQAGIADPDGLKLAGATIREMTQGQDKMTRMVIESMLLRISPVMVAALEEAGFMDKFLKGEITEKRLRDEGESMRWRTQSALQSPAMGWARLGSVIKAGATGMGESIIGGTTGRLVGQVAQELQEGSIDPLDAAVLLGLGVPGTLIGRGITSAKSSFSKRPSRTLKSIGLGMMGASAVSGLVPGLQPMAALGFAGGTAMAGAGVAGEYLSGPWDRLGGLVGQSAERRGLRKADPLVINLEIASADLQYKFAHMGQKVRMQELTDGTPVEVNITTPAVGTQPQGADPYLQAQD